MRIAMRQAMKTQTSPKPTKPAVRTASVEFLPLAFAGIFGLLLGLSLLKFGNPIVMEKYIDTPTNIYQWVLDPWKVTVAWWLLGMVAAFGVLIARWRTEVPRWLLMLPLVWLVWQFVAAATSIDVKLSSATLCHFASCVVCFYLGVFALGRNPKLGIFSLGLLAGFLLVLQSGFNQHFGGLEETRRYFRIYIYPKMTEFPPGLLKKMSTDRIWATLFYPNTLAGVILLVLPLVLSVIWTTRATFTLGARSFLLAVISAGSLACLYWSGSKGGWLLMLVVALVGSLFLPFKRKLKVLLVTVLLIAGLAGFALKYAGFFKSGATSVVARFDYWTAALQTFKAHPILGTGPGTFGPAYEKVRSPESEPAKMTHNDYLEQASDSGLVGLLAFAGWVVGSLLVTFRRGRLTEDWVKLGVWLGFLGWALQSFVEFGLFIPAVAWVAFALMGWLLAQCKPIRIDTPPRHD